MKLFNDFEAVMFQEENLLFITHESYIYYIYNIGSKIWKKHKNAGNDKITVSNYQKVSKKEVMDAMGGIFPQKETDFMRLCDPSELSIGNILNLMDEDYPVYMSYCEIRSSVHKLLLKSNIYYKSYLKLRSLLDCAVSQNQNNEQVIKQIKELSFAIIGKDIYKDEIEIVDGHNGLSYFWIMPVRVIDYTNTNDSDNVAEMRSAEISIEEDNLSQYLVPFLYKHYDDNLEANKKRFDIWRKDDDGIEHVSSVSGFEWYLTHNFFTFDSVKNIIRDINDTIDALSSGRENEFTAELKVKRGSDTCELLYAKGLSTEQIEEYNSAIPKEDRTQTELIIDFYHRFIYRMEYMMKVGEEQGYNFISFMGP